MRDRDFASPFPPWRLFLPFMVVTMFSMIHIGLSVSVFTSTFDISPKAAMAFLFTSAMIFTFINFKITQGKYIYAYFLQGLCIISLILSVIGTIYDKNIDHTDYVILSIIAVLSISSFLVIGTRYYKGCIYYRMRCIALMHKIKNGEKLDDGKYFYEK